MGKRKPSKRKRPSLAVKAGITRKQYDSLIKDARNVRRRITEFSKSSDADRFIIPDVSDYTLANLIDRIASGESFKSVSREINAITAETFKPIPTRQYITASGYHLSNVEYEALKDAVQRANFNIAKATEKFSVAEDILPSPFDENIILQEIVNGESVRNKVKDLSLFTEKNLVPTMNDGVMGTVAEYLYYRRILERENKRREEVAAENDPRTHQGFFKQQQEYDTQPINIDAIQDISSLRQKAKTWDDPARAYRANMYLSNYEKSLDTLESILWNTGQMDEEWEEHFGYIREVIGNLYFNEKAITYLSSRMPQLSIHVISPPGAVGGDIDFDEIYESWADVSEMFLGNR